MSEKNSQAFRVFLNYASEDRNKANDLFQKLTNNGIDVWMDTKKLLPGQDWKLQIADAIENSDSILICLSEASVRKEGYVQKEMKDALTKAEEKPEGTIFVIPVRLDNCKVPHSLTRFQYVDLFDKDGYHKLLKAFEFRAKGLGISFAEQEALQPSKLDATHDVHILLRNMLRDENGLQEALSDLERWEPDGHGWFHSQIRSDLRTIMGDHNHPATERAQAGDILSILGDPRFRDDVWYLPDDDLLGFVEIPAGNFLMGEDASDERREISQHLLYLPSFHIGRYPVTVAQYRSFLLDTHSEAELILSEPRTQNHPIASVSWHDALLYCAWLTDKLCHWKDAPYKIARLLNESSHVVTLPSEAEWEKAARGVTDARWYPWGSINDPDFANYSSDAALGHPSTVGCFEGGKSPFGVYDMAGNVYEWTRTNWGPNTGRAQFLYPYQQDARENIQAPDQILRIIRGGSCYNHQEHIKCSYRSAEFPNLRREHIGFRLAITLLPKS